MNLTITEQSEFYELESVIERGMKTFVEVGNALMRIRDGRLYRRDFSTFEDYCQDRWGLSVRRSYQLIEAAQVINNVKNFSHLPPPATESQAKALAFLKPEQQAAVWNASVETAPNGKVTAAHVQKTVNEFSPPPHATTIDAWGSQETYILPLTAANHAISADPDYDGDEWYTPLEIIEAARLAMGTIDLDPASCKEAQTRINAGEYYDKETNGLSRPCLAPKLSYPGRQNLRRPDKKQAGKDWIRD